MKDRKYKLLSERQFLMEDKQKVQSRYVQLYRLIMSVSDRTNISILFLYIGGLTCSPIYCLQKLREHERQEFQLYESSVPQSANGCALPLNMDHSSGYNSRTTKNKDRKP